jgi:hypothetical protein
VQGVRPICKVKGSCWFTLSLPLGYQFVNLFIGRVI